MMMEDANIAHGAPRRLGARFSGPMEDVPDLQIPNHKGPLCQFDWRISEAQNTLHHDNSEP